jgi:hypothetical protein
MLVATLISPIKIGSPRADKNKPTRPARTCRARSPKLALVSLAALQPVGADYCELLDVLAQHVEELAEVLVRLGRA